MCLELSLVPFSENLRPIPINKQLQFDFADSEGLVQVLQWRSLGQITAQELTALYTEWLRRRGVSKENQNTLNVKSHLSDENKNECLNDIKNYVQTIF